MLVDWSETGLRNDEKIALLIVAFAFGNVSIDFISQAIVAIDMLFSGELSR